MNSDLVGDMFTQLRNARLRRHKVITVTSTSVTRGVASVLFSHGLLDDIEENIFINRRNYLIMSIKYKGRKRKEPVFTNLQRLSKPGSRMYKQSKKIPKLCGGIATVILSTPKGIMTGIEARKKNIGGELLGYFY